ncbi:MAG: hypothetical protein ACRDPR_06295, partial [Nocardioidaceae bacterium]
MRLDSARSLKQEVATTLASQLPSAGEVASFGLAARRVSEVDRVQRTVAIGIAPVKRNDYKLAVRVQRRGLEDSPQVDRVRSKARGEVDVRYIGRVSKRATPWQRQRQRPLLIGLSVGHFEVTAGTLGCFVQRRSGGVRILSNNHVLADENRGSRGDRILQPGRVDGGRARDRIGGLDRYIRMKATGTNLVDCALAQLDEGVRAEPAELHGVGKLAGVAEELPREAEAVAKLGRTTGHTTGRITAFELDNVIVAYDMGNLRFDDQIEIEGAGTGPFSQGGDSGSLIFTSGDHLALALLFSGGDQGG